MPDDDTPADPAERFVQRRQRRARAQDDSRARLNRQISKAEAMATWAAQQRRRQPTMKYSALIEAIRERFEVSFRTAERVITRAGDMIREDFNRFAPDVPRALFDAYMDLYSEALREKNLGQARKALDSVRDMFGMKSAKNVLNLNLTPSATVASSEFADLTDEQLGALALLDAKKPMIDVTAVESTLAAADAELEAQGDADVAVEEATE